MKQFIVALLLSSVFVSPSRPARAHDWFMNIEPFTAGTDTTRCVGRVSVMAERIGILMANEGYQRGTVRFGDKAVRLDGVGDNDTSIYLFCSTYSQYVMTAHSTSGDEDMFRTLYASLLRAFKETKFSASQ